MHCSFSVGSSPRALGREVWNLPACVAGAALHPRVPVTIAIIDKVVAEADRKKDLPSLGKLRFERFEDGLGAPS